MVQNEKSFTEELQELRAFLAGRCKLTSLAKEVGVSLRTVQYAFEVKTPDELKGSKIDVIIRAKSMRKEIENALNI